MENDTIKDEKGPKFSSYGLEPELLAAIDKLGFEYCTPIQAQSIPVVLDKKDIAGLAQTGTGKTAAFLIPLMDRILKAKKDTTDLSEEEKEKINSRAFKDWKKNEFVLVLVPTRELAEQVLNNVEDLGTPVGLRGVSVYGGTGYDKQKKLISEGVEFVVATPGRLIDLFKDNSIDLRQVRAIVFDEADRMFDMGFKDDMTYILRRVPMDRQFLVYSATLNFDVLNTAYQFEAEPVEVNLGRDVATAENVEDFVLHVGGEDKPSHLLTLLKKYNPNQTIIFSNFKMNVERIARFLNENGYHAMGISSLLSQAQRNRVMEQFRSEGADCNILVATDVAARGLDIENVDIVINYELPQDAESYVHRIGRTGRASSKGRAFSLAGHEDVDSMMRVEEYIKRSIEVIWLDESEIIKDYKPFPRGGGYNLKPVSRDRKPGGRDSGGPRSSGPRGRGGRSDRGDRKRGPREESAESAERSARSNTHRDKRRGRHKDQRTGSEVEGRPDQAVAAGTSRPGPQVSGPGAKGSGPKRKKRRSSQEQAGNGSAATTSARRPSSRRRSAKGPSAPQSRPAPAPAKGIGQKVSGFFKKLFS